MRIFAWTDSEDFHLKTSRFVGENFVDYEGLRIPRVIFDDVSHAHITRSH